MNSTIKKIIFKTRYKLTKMGVIMFKDEGHYKLFDSYLNVYNLHGVSSRCDRMHGNKSQRISGEYELYIWEIPLLRAVIKRFNKWIADVPEYQCRLHIIDD